MTPDAAATHRIPSLAPGTRLGVYVVEAPVGAGGMGEVYRARDTRLGRSVALKILPPDVASDPSRRHRFEREARAVAALEHPHICVLHDIGSEEGIDFLVLELLEGQTLARRLGKGRILRDDALRIAIEIADALDAAHRHGITHRDLKPGNVMLTRSGVKVLDFGLAKRRPAGPDEGLETAATAEPTSTETGVVLGTLPYMAPEQVEGRETDARSDIWALGVVLYEMLSGRRAFAGASAASLIASILEHEPEPLAALDALTPPALDRAVRRCLAKDPEARWQSARDVEDELKWVAEGAAGAEPGGSKRGFRRRLWPWVAAAALLAIVVVGLLVDAHGPSRESPHVVRTQLSVAPAEAVGGAQPLGQWIGGALTSLALSPDGRRLAFVGREGRRRQIYVRELDEDAATPIPGTEGAETPTFSPDGTWLVYWARDALWRVAADGGPPVRLCRLPSPDPFGLSWGPAGRIVFGSPAGGLQQVSEEGGEPSVLTELGPGEVSHRLPQVLPGGEAVLFTALPDYFVWSDTKVVVQSLVTGERRVLVEGGADARYVPTGHLVFLRLGSLLAVPFDPVRLQALGRISGMEDGIAQAIHLDNTDWESGAGQFSVSASGTLAYLAGGIRPREEWTLIRVDRSGVVTRLPTPRRSYFQVRVAPDGRRAVVQTVEDDGGFLYLADLETGTTTRLEPGDGAVWSPDGRELLFTRYGKGLFRRAVDEPGSAKLVLARSDNCVPTQWMNEAGLIVVRSVSDPAGGQHYDIEQLAWDRSDRALRPLRAGPSGEWCPEVSPDGRWLAHVSDESGQPEVYVDSFPEGASRRQVSTAGGYSPAWSADGRELFYVAPAEREPRHPPRLMSVRALESQPLRLSVPKPLFAVDPHRLSFSGIPTRIYDVAPDGQSFFAFERVGPPSEASDVTHIHLVLNWAEELKARVPVER